MNNDNEIIDTLVKENAEFNQVNRKIKKEAMWKYIIAQSRLSNQIQSKKSKAIWGNELTSEDFDKIHNEVNLLVSQRFILFTTAITLFGIIGGLILPKQPITLETILFTSLGSLLLNTILFLLFKQSMNVRKFLRVYTTYLRLKGSVWEADWKILREYSFNNSNNKTVDFGHDRIIHTTIFIWLTIFVFLFPILLWVYSLLPFNNIADNKTIFHNFSIDYNKENLKSLENILGLFFLFLQTLFGFIYLFKIREGHKKPDKDDSEIEKAMKKALEEKC